MATRKNRRKMKGGDIDITIEDLSEEIKNEISKFTQPPPPPKEPHPDNKITEDQKKGLHRRSKRINQTFYDPKGVFPTGLKPIFKFNFRDLPDDLQNKIIEELKEKFKKENEEIEDRKNKEIMRQNRAKRRKLVIHNDLPEGGKKKSKRRKSKKRKQTKKRRGRKTRGRK